MNMRLNGVVSQVAYSFGNHVSKSEVLSASRFWYDRTDIEGFATVFVVAVHKIAQ